MTDQDAIIYHAQRATRELDLGLIAGSLPAARAHLKLSSLHFERVRQLQGRGAPTRRPPCIL